MYHHFNYETIVSNETGYENDISKQLVNFKLFNTNG